MNVPNYIIIKIFNYILRDIQTKRNRYLLIERVSLVSKEWKKKILPKLSIPTLRLFIDKENSFKEYLYFISKGISDIHIRFNNNQASEKLPNFIKSSLESQKTFMDSIPKENFNNFKYFGLQMYLHNIDVLDALSKYVTSFTTLNIKIESGGSLNIEEEPAKSKFEQIALNPSVDNIKNLVLDSFIIKGPLDFANYFKNLKTIELYMVRIDTRKLIDLIKKVNPKALVLQSTPFGHSSPIEKFDPLIKECLLEEDPTHRSKMKFFSIFNYFLTTSKEVLIELLNKNTKLKSICITNVTKEPIEPYFIDNASLEKFYCDGDSFKTYFDVWRHSKLRSFNYSHGFGDIELQALKNYHSKYLKDVTIYDLQYVKYLFELIKFNSSVNSIALEGPVSDDLIGLVDVIPLNNRLSSLYIKQALNKEVIKALLKLSHPSFTTFSFSSSETNLHSFVDEISENKSLLHLSMTYVQNPLINDIFDDVIRVLKSNKTLTTIKFPNTEQSSTTLYRDYSKDVLTSDQLQIFKNVLEDCSNYKRILVGPKSLEDLLSNKLIDFLD